MPETSERPEKPRDWTADRERHLQQSIDAVAEEVTDRADEARRDKRLAKISVWVLVGFVLAGSVVGALLWNVIPA